MFEKAVRKVRNCFAGQPGIKADPAEKILNAYDDVQAWHFKKQEAAGFSDEDIVDYATPELLAAMKEWVARGKPI